MSTNPAQTLPRTVFYLTVAYSVIFLLGTYLVMRTEVEPRGHEESSIESSIYFQQRHAVEARSPAVSKPPAVVLMGPTSHRMN